MVTVHTVSMDCTNAIIFDARRAYSLVNGQEILYIYLVKVVSTVRSKAVKTPPAELNWHRV